MAHHGSGPPDAFGKAVTPSPELEKAIHQMEADQASAGKPLGATGQFPGGKLNTDDEGELRLAIGDVDGKVLLDFGKPIHWIAFDPDQALEIARTLVKHAGEALGQPLTMRVARTEPGGD